MNNCGNDDKKTYMKHKWRFKYKFNTCFSEELCFWKNNIYEKLQCDNGHLACSLCCPQLSNKCPSCASPIGQNRCRGTESVLELVYVKCPNTNLGCTKCIAYWKESTHVKECTFSQCSCPALDCDYTGSYKQIYTHFRSHNDNKSEPFYCGYPVDVQMNIASDKMLVLREILENRLFALQCFDEPQGLYVTVTCIAPDAPEVGKFRYCLDYSMSMDGHTLKYESPDVKKVLEVSSQIPQDNYMFVPRCLLRGELLKMKIDIRREVRAGS
ncbi:unnamed protein product [Microthlaspi erraticum]|uniref:SIAH-type domain-containing protein n=1 Tax=Microthlaspi erraticum TaxID=1685480 RepID=A0A6D2KRA6_9BRAS|nr:unnamed protein product [Microthlaspi erraticum]